MGAVGALTGLIFGFLLGDLIASQVIGRGRARRLMSASLLWVTISFMGGVVGAWLGGVALM